MSREIYKELVSNIHTMELNDWLLSCQGGEQIKVIKNGGSVWLQRNSDKQVYMFAAWSDRLDLYEDTVKKIKAKYKEYSEAEEKRQGGSDE